MQFSDETLMAFVDGELDARDRAAVEAALAMDPRVKEAVERHVALRNRLRTTYDPVLQEPVPPRLLSATRALDNGTVPVRKTVQTSTLPYWAAIAASLVAGVLIGRGITAPDAGPPDPPFAHAEGALVARGMLATALDDQLASQQPVDSPVTIGISFRNHGGAFCRAFLLESRAPLAGLACRPGKAWRVEMLVATASGTGAYRQAGSAMPPAVLNLIDGQITGEPLDAEGEIAARAAGWTGKIPTRH